MTDERARHRVGEVACGDPNGSAEVLREVVGTVELWVTSPVRARGREAATLLGAEPSEQAVEWTVLELGVAEARTLALALQEAARDTVEEEAERGDE